MAPLQPDIISEKLGRSLFSTNIIFHETVKSTNSLAKDLGAQGAPEGTLVLAENQMAGRGRMGRKWISPGYLNLLFSILLRPAIPTDQVFVLTMILALATIDGVEDISGVSPMIKWPNDLYVDGKKLGGILTEFSVRGRRVEYVILGLGLNVNWNPEGEKEFLYPATSIFAETGRKISRIDLLTGILRLFEKYYSSVLAGKIEDFYKRWNELSMILGKEMEIEYDRKKIKGRAVRINRNGALIIKDKKGDEQRILSGDVSLRF